jgi:hypothetical protein
MKAPLPATFESKFEAVSSTAPAFAKATRAENVASCIIRASGTTQIEGVLLAISAMSDSLNFIY